MVLRIIDAFFSPLVCLKASVLSRLFEDKGISITDCYSSLLLACCCFFFSHVRLHPAQHAK